MHEAQMHEENCFLTLTYDEKNLPENLSLRHRDIQLFLKRLRKKVGEIRYYMCGEYGGINGRPHYHMCLFGHGFYNDRYKWAKSNGHQLYRSETLEKTWGLGNCTIGELTFETAQYTAGYVVDKLFDKNDDKNITEIIDITTGEIVKRKSEYGRMSLNPAVGKNWLRAYWPEAKDGKIVINGKEATAPKYYRDYFKNTKHHVQLMDNVMEGIKPEDNTWRRLKDRERFTTEQKLRKRRHEIEN